MWKPEDSLEYHFLGAIHLEIGDKVSNLELTSKHGWLSRELPGFICLTCSMPALTGWATTLDFLTWVQGSHSGPRAYVVAGYFANSCLPSPLVKAAF